MENCIFCKISRGDIASSIVYRDKEVVAFRDINPVAPTHILIIPVKHITNLSKVSESDKNILGKIQIIAKKIADEEGISDAFRIISASGAKAGQSVMHLHYHLLGGWKDKKIKMESEPGGLRIK